MPDLGLEVLLKGSNMLRLLQGLWVALRISLIAVVIRLIRSATQSPWSSRSMLLPFNKTSSPKSGITQPPFQQTDRKSTRLNSSHLEQSRMPSSA